MHSLRDLKDSGGEQMSQGIEQLPKKSAALKFKSLLRKILLGGSGELSKYVKNTYNSYSNPNYPHY